MSGHVHQLPRAGGFILSALDWREPVLLGPGSIHVAHTERERVEKHQLHEAVELYCAVAKKLVSG